MKASQSIEQRLQRQILAALMSLQQLATLEKISVWIARGDMFAFYELALSLEAKLQKASRLLAQAARLGVMAGRVDLMRLGVDIDALLVRAAAIRSARESGAALVQNVSGSVRTTIRATVAKSIIQSQSIAQSAMTIKAVIGLTEIQAGWVYKYRRKMLAAGMSPAEAGKATYAYAQRLLWQRSLTIARTENTAAQTRGRQRLWRAAKDAGLLPMDAHQRWIVTYDDRLCPVCQGMAGVTVPLGAEFAPGIEGPPLHPRCRCAVALRQPVEDLGVVAA